MEKTPALIAKIEKIRGQSRVVRGALEELDALVQSLPEEFKQKHDLDVSIFGADLDDILEFLAEINYLDFIDV